MPRIIEESPECELVESMIAIVVLLVDDVLVRPQFPLVNRIKVGGVRRKLDLGLVGRLLLPQVSVKVNSPEELVVLDFV